MVVMGNTYSYLENIPEVMAINQKIYSNWEEISVLVRMTEQ